MQPAGDGCEYISKAETLIPDEMAESLKIAETSLFFYAKKLSTRNVEVFCSMAAYLDESLIRISKMKKPALHDAKYWGGDPLPWRNGTTDLPITDDDVIIAESAHKEKAEEEDLLNKKIIQ